MSDRPFGQSTFFDTPKSRIAIQPGKRSLEAPAEIRFEFVNELDKPLTIVLRNGLPFVLRGQPRAGKRQVIVRCEIILRGGTRHETANVLDQITDKSPATMRALKRAYEQHQVAYLGQSDIVVIVEYVISSAQLRQYGNSLYHGGLDMWMSTEQSTVQAMHPYSEEGMIQSCIWNNKPEAVKDGGALFAVEIVDNAGVFGDRFLNIANEIYPVRSKRDPLRRDGVYVTRTNPSEGEMGAGEVKAGFYPFVLDDGSVVDFTTMHLYRTYVDAKTLGDIASVRKEELAKMDFTLQLNKRELEALKQDHEREKVTTARLQQEWDERLMEKDKRNRDLEAERDRIKHDLDLERLRQKDKYEQRSTERKDSSDFIKLLPALILGLVGLVTTIINLTK